MIRPMIPEKAKAFVDDIAGKGPKTQYNNEPIPENPKIQCYIWEFAQIVDKLFATFIKARCTASGTKLVLATPSHTHCRKGLFNGRKKTPSQNHYKSTELATSADSFEQLELPRIGFTSLPK
jgi:hypothetical protein